MSDQAKLDLHAGSQAADELVKWWEELKDRKGDRAVLRRCSSLSEVILEPAFHTARRRVASGHVVYMDAFASVLGLLSHVESDSRDCSLPRMMGLPKSEEGGSRVSDLRFRRLLKCKSLSEVYGPMLRLIKLLHGNVNIPSLIESIYYWEWEKTRHKWAFDYYDAAPVK